MPRQSVCRAAFPATKPDFALQRPSDLAVGRPGTSIGVIRPMSASLFRMRPPSPTMLSRTVIIGIWTCLSVTALADLPDDFMAALALYNSKKYAQAHEAFLKVAEIAPTPKSKAQSLAYAASSLSRQDQYEQATGLAKSIAVRPISINCRMEIMLAHQKFGELVEAFKDEDISAWPDYIIHRGFYNRGTAYARTRGNTQAATNDLEKAVETSDTTGFFQVRG